MKSTDKRAAVHALMADHYHLPDDWRIRPLSGENLFRLESENRAYVFKFHPEFIRPNLCALDAVYSSCSHFGFTASFIPTQDNRMIGSTDEHLFSLQHYLAPQDPIGGVEALAERLSEVHRHLARLSGVQPVNHLMRCVGSMPDAVLRYGYRPLLPLIEGVEAIVDRMPKQIIHGDLHPNNILCHQGRFVFIDMDSTTRFVAASDVAFLSFRYCGGDSERMERLVDRYNRCTGSAVPFESVWPFVVYNVLQRILFIRIEYDHGRPQWMIDMENQQRFLSEAMHHAS
jgi:Ser/Thr protein kinase RdoA (MazF antagonist)